MSEHPSSRRTAAQSAPGTRSEAVRALELSRPASEPQQHTGGTLRTQLPADLISARHARQAVRDALTAWGIEDPDHDAELLASELVANASEHASGTLIGLALRLGAPRGQTRDLTCEVTDTSARLPQIRQVEPDQERGRGMAIVTALAAASGVRAEPAGKTTWFTLALRDRITGVAREPEAEAGA
jgi:anti-sigma regulatory factor (Ser/Thr protein kinase)